MGTSDHRSRPKLRPVPVLLMVRELGIGGTERQLVETARFLRRDQFTPHVACFRPDGLRTADLQQAGVPVLHLPVYSFKSPAVVKAALQLRQYLHANDIQIVHSFDAPMNVFAVPVARLAGTPAVLSSQRGHRDLTGATLKRLLRLTDRMVDAVVVNCQAMRTYLIEAEHVPDRKIRLCYNGIDIDRYSRRALPPAFPGRCVIGTICALRPEKGVDTLIRAFANVADAAELLIVGGGPDESRLRALSAKLGLEQRCHFQPPTNDVAEWLSQIDIFVLPSRSEALSNSLMEAMACGCCPVATRVGGNPELIYHDRNGLLFPVDDVGELTARMRDLLQNPERRARLAAAAAESIRSRFSFAQAASTMQQIYELVLSAKPPRERSLATTGG